MNDEHPMAAFLRFHGRARAENKFRSLLSLISESETIRTLPRDEELAKESRVRSFTSNFFGLQRAIDQICEENLRAEIFNLLAQILDSTYVVGFYGPKNYLDEKAIYARLAMARSQSSSDAARRRKSFASLVAKLHRECPDIDAATVVRRLRESDPDKLPSDRSKKTLIRYAGTMLAELRKSLTEND